MFIPFAVLIGSGVPSVVTPAGPAAAAVGAFAVGLLVVTALMIAAARRIP